MAHVVNFVRQCYPTLNDNACDSYKPDNHNANNRVGNIEFDAHKRIEETTHKQRQKHLFLRKQEFVLKVFRDLRDNIRTKKGQIRDKLRKSHSSIGVGIQCNSFGNLLVRCSLSCSSTPTTTDLGYYEW